MGMRRMRSLVNTLSIAYMDKLKEISTRLGGKITSQNLININIDQTSNKRLLVKNYKGCSLKIDEYKNIFAIGIKVNSHLAFSVNKIDIAFSYKTLIPYPGFPFKIYAGTADLMKSRRVVQLLTSLSSLFENMKFAGDESIFFYTNYVYIYLSSESDLLPILDKFIDFIHENNDVFAGDVKERGLSGKVPVKLSTLLSFVDKYAIADDSDRQQLIGVMNEKEKVMLISAVKPLFEDINIFLKSFDGEPLSEEAIAIGELAELVSELLVSDE
jgi:hypothetical protein